MPASRGVDGGDGDVDAVRRASEALGDDGEVVALPAADVEHGASRDRRQEVDQVTDEPRLDAGEDSSPRRQDFRRVARPLRPPLMGLQQIDVTAARDVERMSAGAGQAAR